MPRSKPCKLNVATVKRMAKFRRGLRTQIEAHALEIIRLRLEMNNVTPIFRLPPELLAKIFLFCIPVVDRNTQQYDASWISITYVCHYWREVALHAPSLWTDIFVRRGSAGINWRFLDEYLVRSKQAPLYVQICGGISAADNSFRKIIDNLARVESLIVELFAPQLEAAVKRSPPSLPQLHTLELWGRSPVDYDIPRPIPKFLTQITIPSLTSLVVKSYYIDWSTIVLPSTLLELWLYYDCAFTGKWRCSPSEILPALSHLPALLSLGLEETLTHFPDNTTLLPPVTTTVSFPQLRKLHLSGPALPCIHFMQHCQFPASTTIGLSLDPLTPEAIPVVTPLIRSAMETHLIDVISQPGKKINLSVSEESIKVYASIYPTPLLRYEFSLACRPVLASICPQMPLHHMTSLAISASSPDAVEPWLNLAAAMHNVEVLVFTKGSRYRLTHVLLRPYPAGNNMAEGQLRCYLPKLKVLMYQGIEFQMDDEENDGASTEDGEYEYESVGDPEDSDEGEPETGGEEGEKAIEGDYKLEDLDTLRAAVNAMGDWREEFDKEDGSRDQDAELQTNSGDSDGWESDVDSELATEVLLHILFFRSLRLTLRARNAAGYKLDRIILKDCADLDDVSVALVEEVVEVTWERSSPKPGESVVEDDIDSVENSESEESERSEHHERLM
ncbi:hypothetical protein BXZ70DRAFT_1067283 [Cristinia sonorae]|uniref:F-box domain-containing protein n=1 Tax=Cristinia sonorae TaxID=1940300 RepID=A0A8K0XLS9_9AGAR|nr:hypothetical protein BXZ70DRAFT_1067283 [Cristinia sonorae]